MFSARYSVLAAIAVAWSVTGCASNSQIVCEAYVECGIRDDVADCVEAIEVNQDVEICRDVIGYSVDEAMDGDCGGLRNEAAVWDLFDYCYP